VAEALRFGGVGDDGDRHLADTEQIEHIELAGVEPVGGTLCRIGEFEVQGEDGSGLLPARKASRLDPVAALSSE
jgi:hypothetical protein